MANLSPQKPQVIHTAGIRDTFNLRSVTNVETGWP